MTNWKSGTKSEEEGDWKSGTKSEAKEMIEKEMKSEESVMTFDELKAKLDEFVGLVSEPVSVNVGQAALVYKSPTGRELFRLSVTDFGNKYGGGWQFGGNGQALPGSWEALVGMHRK